MQTQGALIANYISEHQLGSMIKQTLMNAFMQVNGAFLDHGMKQTLKGFYFYNNYFDKKQIEKG